MPSPGPRPVGDRMGEAGPGDRWLQGIRK